MVKEICLDSDILIGLLRNDQEAVNVVSSAEGNFAITTINMFELWSGRKEKDVIMPFLSSFHILPFDEKSSLLAGDMRIKLKKTGMDIDIRDIFIAAMCITSGNQLLTNNTKHFERFKQFGLVLV